MAYGPVNVPGGAGADLEGVMEAVKQAQAAAAAAQKAASDAAAAAKNLEESIKNGEIAISSKPVFPVVDADIENPESGEAWILTGTAGNEEEETNG